MKITQHLSGHNLFRVVALLWTIAMIYLCLIESVKVPKFQIPFRDKIVHFSFYFGFMYLWARSFKNTSFTKNLQDLILGILLGITIEFLQDNFTKTRAFDIYDILANTIGALIGFIFVNKFLQNKKTN